MSPKMSMHREAGFAACSAVRAAGHPWVAMKSASVRYFNQTLQAYKQPRQRLMVVPAKTTTHALPGSFASAIIYPPQIV
jgi:hypothetical protein